MRIQIALAISLSLVSSQTDSGQAVSQQGTADFPGVGQIRIEAIEPIGKLPRLLVRDISSGHVLFSLSVGQSDRNLFTIRAEESATNPKLRFALVEASPDSPKILAVAMAPGGSDCGYETTVLGAIGKRLAVLTAKPLRTTAEGGIFLGDLGSERGYGLAVWDFMWLDGEPHIGAHRYAVKLFAYDKVRSRFRFTGKFISQRKYESDDEALSEMGFPFRNAPAKIPDLTC
jgi:hypothetical protein